MVTKNVNREKSKEDIWATCLNGHDLKVSMIQMLIPLGLMAVKDKMEKELLEIVGKKYSRTDSEYSLFGTNPGSVFLSDQKVKIRVPRIQHKTTKTTKYPNIYEAFKDPQIIDESVLKKVFYGLSQRRYEEAALGTAETFGISRSSVSRRFKRASATKLKKLLERDLSKEDIIGIIMDGKMFSESGIIVALGVTMRGRKIPLGIVESGSENSSVVKDFLKDLIKRGLGTDHEILFVIDGSKGFRSAINAVFGDKVEIQRCQWHKRENVVSYLPKKHQANFRQKLRDAYKMENYNDAKRELNLIKKELKLVNESAVRSLEEGFEETLTLHRLGVFKELGTSLKTTNAIESVFSQVGQYTDRVDRWRNSNQRQRWVATALLEIEKSFRRIKGFQHLPMLRQAMKKPLNVEMKRCA